MAVPFRGSKQFSLGVEVEVQIVDPATHKLTQQSRRFLDCCRRRGIGHVKAEIHQSMLEIDTPITYDIKECRRQLLQSYKELKSVARELELELALGGSHPFEHWSNSRVYPEPRYEAVSEKYRWLAKRMTVYGMHVHVGVPDGNAVIEVMNGSVPYLPLLLALAANSPFWQGMDTGLQSCRMGVMDAFPYSGMQKQFPSWAEFERYCEVLMKSKAISSLKDIYWHVRPNADFGTVEFRLCDSLSTSDEMMAVVAFIQCLVAYLVENRKEKKSAQLLPSEVYWVAPENHWIAVRDGFEGMIIPRVGRKRVKIADQLLTTVKMFLPTARKLGCDEELAFVKEMVARGNGASRQRAVYRQSGRIEAVIEELIRQFQTDSPL